MYIVKRLIDFVRDVLEHNNSLITLIDTKAGLVLGSAGIILGLLSFFDRTLMVGNTINALFVTIGLLGSTIIFSFITIFPRLTSKTKGETAIFYASIIQQSKEEYRKMVNGLTPEKIIDDYSDNIFSLAKVQESKFKTLRISLIFMILSVASLIITLHCYFS